jgi:small subunit ribosomal protein S18
MAFGVLTRRPLLCGRILRNSHKIQHFQTNVESTNYFGTNHRFFSSSSKDDDKDPLGALREFENELSKKSDESTTTDKKVVDSAKGTDESEYEDAVDDLLFESADIAEKTKPTDDFLRKVNPVLFYKRKVNQMWERKECYFCETDHVSDLHYTNIPLLSFFVSEGGNILPRRVSHCCAKHQRKLARTIKHSRHVGLFPFRGNMSGRFPLEGDGEESATN